MLIAGLVSILLHVPIVITLILMGDLTSKTTTDTLSQATKVQLLQSLADLTQTDTAKDIETAKEKPKLEYQDTEAINETTEKLDTNLFGAHTTKAASTQQEQVAGTDITQTGTDLPYRETLSTPLTLPQEAQPAAQQSSMLEAIDPTPPQINDLTNEIVKKEAATSSSELLETTYTNPDKALTIDKAKPEELPQLETQLIEVPKETIETQLPTPNIPLSLPNQQTQLKGLSTMANQSSLEVNKSQLGEYGKEMSTLVELSWQKYNLENRQYIDPGFLRIRFKVNANGFTSDFEIIEVQGCNDVQKSVTIEAIKHCKLPPIPEDLLEELGEEFFFVSYTFYY